MGPEIIVTDLPEHVFTECTPTRPDCRIKCKTPVTIVTQVIKLQVTQEMHNYRVIRPFSYVSAIRKQAGRS
jgi:hypothetical protein